MVRSLFLAALLALAPGGVAAAADEQAVRLILDTDFSPDADDVGAVAVLHNVAAEDDRVEILAMMISSGDPWAPQALAVVNAHYGRADIPIGVPAGGSYPEPSAYTEAVAGLDPGLALETRPAVALYREILAAQPDGSVIIVAIGTMTNLGDLLDSPADGFSPLAGAALVEKKAALLICMGGRYPSGREWNFYQDVAATRAVTERWPTRIDFLGFELAEDVITGTTLDSFPAGNPLRLSYELHNEFEGRPSWDQLAVLHALSPPAERERLFSRSPPGVNTVRDDGSNFWLPRDGGPHAYLKRKANEEQLETMIDELMLGVRQGGVSVAGDEP